MRRGQGERRGLRWTGAMSQDTQATSIVTTLTLMLVPVLCILSKSNSRPDDRDIFRCLNMGRQ